MMQEQHQQHQSEDDVLSNNKNHHHHRERRRKKLICLFGLSADPPTGYGGHVGIVQTLQRQQIWDEIWVLPVYRHTYQEKRERLVSFEHRFRMCQLAFAHLNDSNDGSVESAIPPQQTKVIVSDAELQSWKRAAHGIADEADREKISVGTAVLLDYVSTAYEDDEFYFCLGADSFIDLVHGKWQQTDRILNKLLYSRSSEDEHETYRRRIVVLYRPETKIIHEHDHHQTISTAVPQQQLVSVSSDYLVQLQQLVQEYGVQLIHMSRSEENISSTFVRNCSNIATLHDNPAIILPTVLQYIQQHKLYQNSNC